jgi:hypothetical protein
MQVLTRKKASEPERQRGLAVNLAGARARTITRFVLLLCLLACTGCGKTKSTDELIQDLKSGEEKDRVTAIRQLPLRKADADRIVPALIGALKDKEADVRKGAALGLASFGEQASSAIPDLEAARNDKDIRVRNVVGMALSRIDPQRFPGGGREK